MRGWMARCLFSLALAGATASATGMSATPTPTRVAILGVEHAAQLVSERDQPGVLAAFLEQLAPDAVCIERPPEQAARGDYYEYTYEVQGVILPYAATHAVAVCPIDWMPPVEDARLGFGMDLDTPLELRREQGFQGFLAFPDKAALQRDFFAADAAENLAAVQKWAQTPAPRADQDLPRRLYLYRTFLQAQRIRAAALAHPGKTVLVVVGYFHKPDLEAILAHDPAIALVKPSTLGRPTADAVERATTATQRAAILAFNLLGAQADTGNVDWAWMTHVLDTYATEAPAAETALLRTRLALLRGQIAPAEARRRYARLAEETPAALAFGWTGVQDRTRVDSFFDPFGNLTVRQRATLELARTDYALGRNRDGEAAIARLKADLSPRKALQLSGYAARLLPATGKGTAGITK
ncbi:MULTISPECIES: hypothetical protein [unclassified Xanthomonas]|uniref:hypothetical protein n=1 Tax=Xanthomonas sp. LMG 9002 TaxID=1591158 RepID=UPI001367DF48|nr:hypothetical protein [Xanthomonas sp. LMG 9002]MXV07027.1 hypothetical protein [Xanthomonas sp. LMG 9002]